MVERSGLGARLLRAQMGVWLLLALALAMAMAVAWVPLPERPHTATAGRAQGPIQTRWMSLGATGHRADAFARAGSRRPARVTFTAAQPLPSQPTARLPSQRPADLGPWWWWGALLAATLTAAAAVRAWRRPSYRVELSIEIGAKPALLIAWLADLRRWPDWSTLAAFGPGVARRFDGADPAPGSAMSWADTRRRRQGRIELDGAGLPDRLVVVCTRAGSSSVRDLLSFRLAPANAGGDTRLHCVSHGQAPWLARLLDPVLPVEARKARQLNAELAALKRAAEAAMIAP